MANSNRTVNIQISSNSEKAQKDMAILSRIIEQIQQRMQSVANDSSLGAKERQKAIKALMKEEAAYQKMYDRSVDALTRVNNVIVDLATSSTRDLQRAFQGASKSIRDFAANDPRLEETKKKMAEIGAQIRKNLAAMVDIEKNINRLNEVSDDWLSTAIKSQKEQLTYIERSDAAYQKELNTLQKLTAEEEKRKAALGPKTISEADARSRLSSMGNHTEAEIQEAINKMRMLRDEQKIGSAQWQAYDNEIRQANEDLDKMKGKVKAVMTEAEANNRLGNLWGQSESSLKELQQYLEKQRASVGVLSDEWKTYDAQLKQVATTINAIKNGNAPYVPNRDSALHIADPKSNAFRFSDGTGYDIKQKDLEWAKKFLQQDLAENTWIGDAPKIEQTNRALANLEQKLKALNGTTQQTSRLSRDAALKLKDILKNPSAATGNDIKNTIEVLNKRLGDLPVKSKGADNLRHIIDQLQKSLKNVADEAVDVNAVLNKMKAGKASVEELRMAYKQLEQELAQVAIEDKKGIKQRREQMAELKNQIDEVTGATKKQNSAISTTIKNMVAYVGVFGALNMIKSKMTEIIQLNLKFSDQLADIRKVSGLATKDVEKLANNLAKIDTRTSVEELNQIAYAGAKLGMGKYGIDGMNQFVQAANQVNVALKEDLGQDALTALSKITEVMGLIPKMGVEQSMLATGSAMFKLSATSTATSENIVEFTKRLTGIARTAGMTTPQLLALGSAADSMMLMPEVASTAFNKLITSLQRSPGAIEQSLGITKGTIDNLFSAGKTMDAIVLILEKMKAKGNMNALDDVFKDLGSDGARLIQVMVTMSKNVDMLKGHLYTSTEAFEEAKAVTDEYNIQQQTANALMERAANTWEKMFVNSAQVTEDATFNIRAMAQRWYELSEAVSKSGTAMFGVNSVLTILSATVQGLIYAIPAMVSALVSGGVVYAIANAASLYRQLAAAMEAVKKAYIAMNLAAKTAGWAGLIMTLGTLIATIIEMRKKTDEAVVSFEKLNQYRKEAIANATEETRKLKEYINVLSDVNISQQERERLIQKFNNQYGEYIQKLGIEINTVDDLKNAYSRLNDEIKKKTISEMRDKAMSETTKPLAEESHTRYNELRDVLANRNYGAIDARYVKGLVDQGQGTEAIFKKVIEAKYGTGVTVGRGGNVAYRDANGKVQKGVLSDVYGAILNYVNAETKYNQGIATVNNEFSDLLGDWTNEEATVLGHLRDKPDPKAAAAAAREQRREWRDQLKEAEDQAKAIIDQIKNYYERQETEIIKKATELGQSEDVKKAFVEANEKRKNAALANVRKAIVGTDNDWDNYVLTIIQDLKEPLDANGQNESTKLVNAIKENNLVGLRKMIATLSKNLNKPESATMDAIWKNASLNEQANAKIDNTAQRRRQKESLEHDYTGIVEQKSMEGLFGMGFFNATQDDWRNAMSQVIPMLRQARKDIVNVLATDGDKDQLLTVLFGKDYKKVIGGDDSALKPLLDMSAEDARLFYQKLIQYSDEYTEAEKKKYEEAKKVVNQMYDAYAKANEKTQADIQTRGKIFGNQQGFGSQLGIVMPKNDPEVALYKAKQEAAEEYYRFVMENSKNQQLQQEAELAMQKAQYAMLEKMAAATRERMQKLYSLTAPLEQFGDAMGTALATFSDKTKTAEERTEAFKKAVLDATKAMIKSWGDMLIAALKAQMQQNITNGQLVKTVNANAPATPSVSAAEGANTAATTDTPAGGSIPGLGVLSPDNPQIAALQAQHEAEKAETVSFHDFMIAENQRYRDAMKAIDEGKSPFLNMNGGAAPEVQAEKDKQQKILDVKTMGANALSVAAKKGLQQLVRTESLEKKKEVKLFKDEEGKIVETKEEGANALTEVATSAAQTMTQVGVTEGAKQLAAQQSQDQQSLQSTTTTETGKTGMHMVSGIAKAFSDLGPIGGAVAAATITSLITGLLSWALGLIGGGKKTDTSTNTKLVSGMLTYDEGNVSQYVGTDGNVYSARNAGNLPSGVSMITSPIATTVNGQPSLVAERGPEIVIGRQTTAAIMQNAPYLLSMLAQYDRNRSVQPMRLYDDGNISDMSTSLPSPNNGEGQGMGSDPEMKALMASILTYLQNPVAPNINMYGANGLHAKMQQANQFMARH